jgi:hypothetical protein
VKVALDILSAEYDQASCSFSIKKNSPLRSIRGSDLHCVCSEWQIIFGFVPLPNYFPLQLRE